jgi:LmbE family N-acetylglucosaminyl deacetylase
MTDDEINWSSPRRILVILAHPDDPEFFCGASVARWTDAGNQVVYWLLTCGDKGASDASIQPQDLCRIRHAEQHAAAAVLGVTQVNFLDYPDGHLVPDIELRRQVTRIIRKERPDILVTCDPTTLIVGDKRLNHPDHRAAGQVVLDAAFPAAGNPLYFPELLHEEKLEPHSVSEIWISGTLEPNLILDVTDLWERKLTALYEHKSQIGDIQAFTERMRARYSEDSTPENPRYEERFRRIIFA